MVCWLQFDGYDLLATECWLCCGGHGVEATECWLRCGGYYRIHSVLLLN